MEVINENWLATVTHLTTVIETSNKKDAAVANGLYKSITSVKFVTFLGFMCDYTYTISLLSKAFQSDKLTLSSALDELDASLGSLEQLCTYGHTLTKFVAEFDDSSNPSSFRGIDITGGKRELDATRKSLRTLAIKSKEYLERRFKVDGIFQDFDIIDPTNWPASGSERGKKAEYGLEEITHILQLPVTVPTRITSADTSSVATIKTTCLLEVTFV